MKNQDKIHNNIGNNLFNLFTPVCFTTTLLLLLLSFTKVTAQEAIPVESLDVTANQLPTNQTLDPLKPEEILSSNRGTANSQQELLAAAPFQNSIIRNFTWRRRVPLDQLPQQIRVNYSLKSYNDQDNKFSQQTNANSVINVTFREERSQIEFQDPSNNIAVIGGSIQLVLDPSRARAGTHGGRLNVCIVSRSGGCL